MNRIIFNSVEIIDPINKKYIRKSFIDGINLITSEETSRGKSSLIRALYHSMGANSCYDKKFKANDKIFIVQFSSGDNRYRIIRYKNIYFCYKNENLIKKILNDYKELSKLYEQEFNMSVYLTDKNNKFDIAPVAYSFIPYVLDQDNSWKSNNLPFSNMGQFLDANRIDLYYFHLNVLNLEYYRINKNKLITEQRIHELKKRVELILEEIKTLKEYNNAKGVVINLDDAKVSLENMKNDLTKSIEENNFIQNQLLSIENRLITLNSQKYEIEKILDEIIKDKNQTLKTKIKCPECNTEIDLSNYDELKSSYTIEFLKENLKNINFDIEILCKERMVVREKYYMSTTNVEKIKNEYNSNNNLFEKYVSLNAVYKMLKNKEKDVAKVIDEINQLDDDLLQYKLKIDKYSITRTLCGAEFKDKYLDKLTRLGVKNITKNDLVPFKKIILSGSQDPRSALSFYLAFLEMKRNYNPDNFKIPLVIDSPFEGDPDEYNKQDIINDILSFYGFGEQLIIGLRNASDYFKDVDYPVNIITLTNDKDSLLSSIEFEKNINHVTAIVKLVTA